MKLWFEKGAWASKKAKQTLVSISPDSINSIAIIRHAAIGDMMVLRPFLLQAREFFPNAKITLSIVNTYSYGIPTDLVDRVHVIDKTNNGIRTSYISRLKQIRTLETHDLIFDMADTTLSQMISLLSNARVKIGFPYKTIKRYFYDVSIFRSDLVPEVETLLHMLYILGAPKKRVLEYGYPHADSKEYRIVYFMGASVPSKQWPQKNFIQLIQRMAEQYPTYNHIVLEGIGINEQADSVMQRLSNFQNVSKSKPLPLDETMKFLSDSKLVVCNDTGIRNMAIASSTCTVGLFFSTVPYRYLPDATMHHAVFESDGQIPSVDQVYTEIQKVLTSF